jgi:hypothetical protein
LASKAAFDAKKAAKEEKKLNLKQRRALAKEGEPFINLLIYFSTPFNLVLQSRQPFRPLLSFFVGCI